MMTYKQTKNRLIIEIKSKLHKHKINYDNKKTRKQYTSYTAQLPKAVTTYLNPESNKLYFYKNNNLYLTGHDPGDLFDVYKTTYDINRNSVILKIPKKIVKDFYSSIIFSIDPTKKDFFTNKNGEIKITFI